VNLAVKKEMERWSEKVAVNSCSWQFLLGGGVTERWSDRVKK